jgi:hypothetical protein
MSETPTTPRKFFSSIPYEAQRIRAAAIYCSDGRLGQHFDDFLYHALKLPRYDRIALPGGPAALAGHLKARINEQAVVDELKFLTDAHEVDHVVLIAHQNCAFYGARLNMAEETMEPTQREDLIKAARFVYRATGLSKIESYFARFEGERISFERVETDPLKPF